MGQILCAPPGCSPYKPGGLGFENRERVVSNFSFTAILLKRKSLILLEKVGFLWFFAFEKRPRGTGGLVCESTPSAPAGLSTPGQWRAFYRK